MAQPSQENQFNNKKQVDQEKFTKETIFVNLWKGLSWFLLMGIGVFIGLMPWLAASFGLVLPTILAGFTFPAMLILGLIIGIPALLMTAASVLNVFHKRNLAKLFKNIAFGTMALIAVVIGILLFNAPGLPVISAFAGMIGGLGSLGALLTKISLIALGAFKVFDVVWDVAVGSLLRAKYGAIGKDLQLVKFGISKICLSNLPKIIRNLALIALGIFVCLKLSLAVGLIIAISSGLKLVANFLDKHGNKRAHQVAKVLNNLVRGIFGGASLFLGVSFLQPAVLVGFLGKLSFVAAAFPGVFALIAGISLIVFGALTLAKTVTDVICGDQEKFKQGAYEIIESSFVKDGGLNDPLGFLNIDGKKDQINGIVPNLVSENNNILQLNNMYNNPN